MTYEAFITWLEKVPLYGHKDGINNIRKLLARLGHPEKCAPVIHVAGTNGKGSCCAMMASVLQRSGMKVGLFTSPHLVTYGERIRVDGINISEEELVRLGLEVKKQLEEMVAAGENHCTFFEILTAIGFLYFAREQVDVIVLEVGVGGRLDATNVVEEPALCLIASISLDHTKVLGDTLEAIAAEKAGILKAGRPVVLSENPLCVQQVVETAAREKGCPFIYAPSFESGASDYPIPLAGNYQKQNRRAAVTALRLLQQQGFPITEESLREGLARTDWPGRMQTLQVEGQTVLMDGAHNPGGARMLADYLDQSYAPGSCTLVFSALGKKDLSGILQPLAETKAIGKAVFTCIHGEDNTASFLNSWKMADGTDMPYEIVKSPMEALKQACAEKPGLVVCAGSLYLLGELLGELQRDNP